MHHMLQRYLMTGQLVEMIYLDRYGRTTKRTIRVCEICGNRVKAYCFTRQAFRVFALENILAVQPVVKRYAAGY